MYSTIPNSTTSPIASLDLDIRKKEEDRKNEREEYIDRFNFWIYVGFIVLGILFLLTFALLIYSIFFNQEKEIKIDNSISAVAKPIDNSISSISKPIDNSSPSILKSIFKSKPIDNSISSISKPIDNSISSITKPIDNSSPSILKSIFKSKPIDNSISTSITKPIDNSISTSTIKPIDNSKNTSFIASLLKKKDIETEPKQSFFSSLFNKNNSSSSLPKLEKSSVSSILNPILTRKIEKPK